MRSVLLAVALNASCGFARPADVGPATDAMSAGGDGSGSNVDAPPSYGAQLDRVGRPMINTFLNHTFDTNTATADSSHNDYNLDSSITAWVTSYRLEFQGNLAVFDGFDQQCGDQVFYAAPTGANSYQPGASVFADDQLYLDSSKTTCTTYFALELAVQTGIASQTCGGRTLDYDVVDATYMAVIDGNADTGVTDGADKHSDLSTSFPFLGAPH